MKSFDEWYREAKKLNNDGFSAKDFFIPILISLVLFSTYIGFSFVFFGGRDL